MKSRYFYQLSSFTWVLSITLTVALAFVVYNTFKDGGYFIIIGVLTALILLAAIAVMPIYIEESEKYYKLRLLFFPIIFQKSEYRVREVAPETLKGSIRTFGSGGLFGFTGYFRNKSLGKYTAFISNTRKPLLLFSNGKKKIIVNAPR